MILLWTSQGILKIKITSYYYRSREDRACDRIRSIRICRSSGERSASTVPTTGYYEALGKFFMMGSSTHDNFFLKVLSTTVLKTCFRLSRRAARDREHRRKVNNHRQDIQPCRSQRLYRLDSVNANGGQSQQRQSTK